MPKPSREEMQRQRYMTSIDPRLRIIRERNMRLREGGGSAVDRDRERRHDVDPEAFHSKINADPTSCPVCIVRKSRVLRGLAEQEDEIVAKPVLTELREAIAKMKAPDAEE